MKWASGYCDIGVRPADCVYNLGLLNSEPIGKFDGFGVTQQGTPASQGAFQAGASVQARLKQAELNNRR